MQALRLARPRGTLRCLLLRAASSAPASTTLTRSSTATSAIPLSNIEAQWEKFSGAEQLEVHQQLEELQKKDWRSLSIDEKKAAYYVAFGPHGPRTPVNPPGTALKVFLGTAFVIAMSVGVFAIIRANAPPPPRTMTKEWQEESNRRAIETKQNPITGIASEGYTGKGHVQSR